MTPRRLAPLVALRAFEACARLGGQTQAARELRVTPGAVSRHLRALEKELGEALYEGPRNRPVLTAQGRRLAAALAPGFAAIEAAFGGVAADEREIGVACFNSFALRWLIPRLPAYQERHPRDDVRLRTRERTDHAPTLRDDVSILALEPGEAMLSGDRLLFREQMSVVTSPRLARTIRTTGDLARLRELGARGRPDAWAQWREGAGVVVSQAGRAQLYDHYAFALEAAAAGQGACAAPRHLVLDDLAQGRLVEPFAPVETGYRYVVRLRAEAPAAARRFRAWLVKEAATEKSALGAA
jgi:DNA-binding transcriptional LysR family regulator